MKKPRVPWVTLRVSRKGHTGKLEVRSGSEDPDLRLSDNLFEPNEVDIQQVAIDDKNSR